MNRLISSAYLLPLVLASAGGGAPLLAWAQGAPVVARTAAQVSSAQQALQAAVAQAQRGQYTAARDALKLLINTPEEPVRSQSRYVLGWALFQLNDPEQALQALEGTLSDTSSAFGKAVGTLRGTLMLHLAEVALNQNQPDKAARWLADYERLSVRADNDRLERLKFTLSPVGERLNTPLRVGVIIPQTGSLGQAGADVLRAMQLALPSLTANSRAVTLLVRDATTPAEVAQAAAELKREGIDIAVGPLLAPAVAAAKGALGGVPLLTLSSDADVLGEGVHTLNFLPGQQAEAAARYVQTQGKSRFAALIPQGAYGEAALGGLRDGLSNQNATLVKTAFYVPNETDIGASIRELKDAGPFEALLLPAPGRLAPMLAAQLAYYDLDRGVQLIGTALWQEPAVLAPSASGLRGSVFAAPARDDAATTRFTTTFGAAPHPLAALGIDAAYVLAQVAVAQAQSGQNVNTLLLREEGFYAPGGAARFLRNGQTLRALSITEVGSGAFTTLKTAAPLFASPLPENLLPEPRRSWW
ncbi:MAG: penicillin-binding protein activator [Pseudomonadota bacterium]